MSVNLPTVTENRIVTGLLPGFNQPVAVVKISFPGLGPNPAHLQAIDQLLAACLPGYTRQWSAGSFNQDDIHRWILVVLDQLHTHTLTPRLADGRVEVVATELENCWLACVLYPVTSPQHSAVNFALHWLIQLFHSPEVSLSASFKQGLAQVIDKFRIQHPSPVGLAHFLSAANQRGIPWQHISNNLYQYGWGKHARLLDGTFTDSTPNIATRICMHKPVLNQVLRAAGIPVPVQIPLADPGTAQQAAQTLGYPVVIKPSDRDRGEGVSINLRTSQAVQEAVERAGKFSRKLLMESHCPGDDYRVYVLDGQVLHVVRRYPGGVTGNGQDTVRQLLDTLNADPIRQPAVGRRKQIKLDTEALDLLREQGLTPESIIPAGSFVALRRTPNISSGGEATEIPLADIHPDNLALFIRTARLLHLDIAGIDFLSVDISTSWLENGGVICEVNAQPQHPPRLAEPMLARLVNGTGRVPVVVVVENRNHVAWLDDLLGDLQALPLCTGVARASRLELDGREMVRGRFDAPFAAQQLLRDPALACLIMQISDIAMLDNGLPVDAIDVLVLSGITGFPAHLPALAGELASRSRQVLIDTDSPLWKQPTQLFQTPERCPESQLQARLLATITALAAPDRI